MDVVDPSDQTNIKIFDFRLFFSNFFSFQSQNHSTTLRISILCCLKLLHVVQFSLEVT